METTSYLDGLLAILALTILVAGVWMLLSGVGDLNR
jgi:hypothetical protein